MKWYIKSASEDASQGVVKDLLQLVKKYGYEPDPEFEENPAKASNKLKLYIVHSDAHVKKDTEADKYIPTKMLDEIDKLSESSGYSLLWSFGPNLDGQVTGIIDIKEAKG